MILGYFGVHFSSFQHRFSSFQHHFSSFQHHFRGLKRTKKDEKRRKKTKKVPKKTEKDSGSTSTTPATICHKAYFLQIVSIETGLNISSTTESSIKVCVFVLVGYGRFVKILLYYFADIAYFFADKPQFVFRYVASFSEAFLLCLVAGSLYFFLQVCSLSICSPFLDCPNCAIS